MSRTMRPIACLAAYLLPVPVSSENNGLEARGLICYVCGGEGREEGRGRDETRTTEFSAVNDKSGISSRSPIL